MTNVLNEINGRVTILFQFNLDKQWLNKIRQHTYVLPSWDIGLNLILVSAWFYNIQTSQQIQRGQMGRSVCHETPNHRVVGSSPT